MQVTGKGIATTEIEISDFLGLLLFMGVISLPAYKDYWAAGTWIEQIADVMSLRRFKQLRRFVHFNYNSMVGNSTDRYYKVRPMLDIINKNCLKYQHENQFSIDDTKGQRLVI